MEKLNINKKFTKSSLKSFIKNNIKNIYIGNNKYFNWMIDGISEVENKSLTKIKNFDFSIKYTYWIAGLWLVGSSRDSFAIINENTVEVYNCCWSCFITTDKNFIIK